MWERYAIPLHNARQEVSYGNNCVSEDFGALAVQASACPCAAILLDSWPRETLGD
jgi:hypothetical protein